MSQLGERLRESRERLGVTLTQAAAETRILQRYLVALEEGDYLHLPGDVYARGFVRNYARYLGLPPEEMVELYRRERGMSEPIQVKPVTSAPRVRGVFLPSFFGVFFVVLFLIGLSYLALSTTNQISSTSEPTAITVANAPTLPPLQTAVPPTAQPTAVPTSVAAPTVDPATTPNPSEPTPAGAGGVQLTTATPSAPIFGEVRIRPDTDPGSWLDIIADGQSVYQGILPPGASQAFTAQRRLEIRVGNAGAVTIVVNGREFTELGGLRQAVTFNWPPQ
jgi:transcriptional regulator with XRE-family HTH domain